MNSPENGGDTLCGWPCDCEILLKRSWAEKGFLVFLFIVLSADQE